MSTYEQVWRYCRVCGYEPADPPWDAIGLAPTYEFCPCCGVEYGNEDYTESSTTAYRNRWLSDGAEWVDPRYPGDGLSTSERLQLIGSRAPERASWAREDGGHDQGTVVDDQADGRGGVERSDSIVDEFVATEVNESVRQLLIDAVQQPTRGERRFEFNVFDVRIRRDIGVVVVEDVLDATRSEQMVLLEFRRRLGSRS